MSEKKTQNPFYALFLSAMRHKLRPQRNIIVGERNGVIGIVVYADLLFLIDFSMDLLTLYIVSKVLRRRISLLRMVSAAAMGGVYSVATLSLPKGVFSVLFGLFVCFVMCMTALLSKRWENFAKMPLYTCLFFVVSSLLGGMMTAFYSLLNRNPLTPQASKNDLSLWVFAIGALASGAATLMGSNLLSRTSKSRHGELKITIGQRHGCFSGLSDSGNLLRDPIGGKAVIVLDRDKAEHTFPLLFRREGTLSPELAVRVRMIPIKTASGSGLLTAVRPDKITLTCDGEEREIDALIASSKEKISDGGADAVIPLEFFT